MAKPKTTLLSSLPNDTLHKILTLLPIKDATRTSCLSTRFRRLPFSNPNLNLYFSSDDDIIGNNVTSIIDSFLIQASKTPKIRSIKFPLVSSASLRRWVRFAADREVTEITFRNGFMLDLVEIPRTLFECEFLESIKMTRCSFNSVPIGWEKFSRLKSVVLAYVDVKNEVLNGLMAMSPVIETIAVMGCRGLTRIAIVSRTLKSLSVNCDDLVQLQVLWAPQLHRFMYDGDLSKIKSLEGLRNLEEATILSKVIDYDENTSFKNHQQMNDLISSLAHVKILSVNSWFLEEGKQKTIFSDLKEFHFWSVHRQDTCWTATHFNDARLLNLVSTFQDFPSLELFCFHGYCNAEESEDEFIFDAVEGTCSLRTPYCCEAKALEKINKVHYLLPLLKKVKMVDFSMKKVRMVYLLKFLASKASELKSMVIYYPAWKEEKMKEIREVISSMKNTSKELNISLINDPHGDICTKFDTIWWQFTNY